MGVYSLILTTKENLNPGVRFAAWVSTPPVTCPPPYLYSLERYQGRMELWDLNRAARALSASYWSEELEHGTETKARLLEG